MPEPDALLLIAPGCPHCPQVLESLGRLVKEGAIGILEVVNIAVRPERAAELGVRSVPWVRIGDFDLHGMHSHRELAEWAANARDDTGYARYYSHLIENQQLDRVVSLIRGHPTSLVELVGLLGDKDTPMGVRIGIGAALEDLQGGGLLDAIVPELVRLTGDPVPQTRADACHYLGLARGPEAAAAIRSLLDDADPEVREIAAESLHLLETAGAGRSPPAA